MNFEDFHILDKKTIGISFINRSFLRNYHQQSTHLNDSDQNFEFIFGENDVYHQSGNAYLQYGLTIEKDVAVAANRVLVDGDNIRLVNNAVAYCFEEARLKTTGVVI